MLLEVGSLTSNLLGQGQTLLSLDAIASSESQSSVCGVVTDFHQWKFLRSNVDNIEYGVVGLNYWVDEHMDERANARDGVNNLLGTLFEFLSNA